MAAPALLCAPTVNQCLPRQAHLARSAMRGTVPMPVMADVPVMAASVLRSTSVTLPRGAYACHERPRTQMAVCGLGRDSHNSFCVHKFM